MDISIDKFLGGRLELKQPLKGFRAGTDTVMMAAAVPAKSGDRVLDIGAGSGGALCCLGARVAGLSLVGLEIQHELAALARDNLEASKLEGEVVVGDVLDPPAELKGMQFDHVMMNPPFYDYARHVAPDDATRARAHIGQADMRSWTRLAYKRLAPSGQLTIIHRAEALGALLGVLKDFGDIRILPIAPHAGREAKNVMISARKDRKGTLRLLAPFYTRTADGAPTQEVEAITRHAQGLAF